MVTKTNQNIIFDPVGELTIKTVEEAHGALKESIKDGYDAIFVNLIGVTEIDSAGLQLLASLKRDSDDGRKIFDIVGMSTEAEEIISLFGLGNFFGKQEA